MDEKTMIKFERIVGYLYVICSIVIGLFGQQMILMVISLLSFVAGLGLVIDSRLKDLKRHLINFMQTVFIDLADMRNSSDELKNKKNKRR